MEKLILASGSPRRRELLDRVGIPYEVFRTETDETCALPAPQAVLELSRRKALFAGARFPGRFILAADTLVALEGRMLGKPASRKEAEEMLTFLSGRKHSVHTGVTVIAPEGQLLSAEDTTFVSFCELSREEILSYVDSGEPLDKAGAYALQGRAGLWVERIEGCDSSVIGLPLYLVRRLLLEAGYQLP